MARSDDTNRRAEYGTRRVLPVWFVAIGEFGWFCSDGRYSVRALARINFARIQGPPNRGLAGRMGSVGMGRAEATDQLASL